MKMTDGRNRVMLLKMVFALLIISFLEDIPVEATIFPCAAPLENIAIEEGSEDTFIYFPASSNGIRWINLATTDELTMALIVDFDDKVHRSYASDYGYNSTGLLIKKATIRKNEPVHMISTSGLYTAQCGGGSESSFKVLVVKQGPLCSCTRVTSSTVQLTCSSVYADSVYAPIAAVFTLYDDDGGLINSDTPKRNDKDGYTYVSSSTFTANYKSSSIYKCVQTFDIPREIQNPNIAMNAPIFNQSCSVPATDCHPPATAASRPQTTTRPQTGTTKQPLTTSQPQKKTTKPATTTSKSPMKTNQPPTSEIHIIQPLMTTSNLLTVTSGRYTKVTPTSNLPSTTCNSTTDSTAGCDCAATITCPPPDTKNCDGFIECQTGGTLMTAGTYSEGVVKAELYARCEKCCPKKVVWGVVVTLRNDSRWLIHDPICHSNTCQMVVVEASCMSSEWQLLSVRSVTNSVVNDYVQIGNGVQVGSNTIHCSESCGRIINLP